MHHNTIYAIIRKTIAKVKRKEPSDIYAHQKLVGDLRFSPGGKRSLADDLNKAFKKEGKPIIPRLHGDETVAAKIVQDLRMLITARFG
jgi:hypothetical protein